MQEIVKYAEKIENAQNKTDTQSPTSYDEQENVASTTNPPVLGDEPRQVGKKMDFLLWRKLTNQLALEARQIDLIQWIYTSDKTSWNIMG